MVTLNVSIVHQTRTVTTLWRKLLYLPVTFLSTFSTGLPDLYTT